MSYLTANRSLNSRLHQEDNRANGRRRSSLLSRDLLSGGNTNSFSGSTGSSSSSNNNDASGLMFDMAPGERQAKFEEWIKLTTDNKINTSNSWAVALIDYFHDMEVFRDGDGINFQKASTTLDGCVKIYSSRIDSVITETGKLLSGLASKKNGDNEDDGDNEPKSDEEGDDEDDENDNANGAGKLRMGEKAKIGSTLKKWRDVKMRGLDKELNIDPLFKKTLAEFDEGGAKSLLMHMLSVDEGLRIMFDTSTGALVAAEEDAAPIKVETSKRKRKINVGNLKAHIYDTIGETSIPDNVELCPSLVQLNDVVHDIEKAKSVLKDINYDTSFNMSVTSAAMQENSIGNLDKVTQAVLFNDDFGNGDFAGADVDFGNDGADDEDDDDDNDNDNDNANETSAIFANTTVQDKYDDTELDNRVLTYFDEQLKSNWTGPVHWKVRALKGKFGDIENDDEKKDVENKTGTDTAVDSTQNPSGLAKSLKKKEFRLDFLDGQDIADEDIFVVNKKSKINMILKEAEDLHLLPDDTFFSSKNLIHLFTKEDRVLKLFKVKRSSATSETDADELALHDEKFFAENYEAGGPVDGLAQQEDFGNGLNDGMDPLGGALDDDDDDDDDNDVLPDQEIGTQLLPNSKSKNRRTVNFARVAKRVDLIALKDNLWKSIEKDQKKEVEVLEFKDIVKTTVKAYPAEEKKDLSTSFEFIALLHLANEKGFNIETNEDHSNLFIKFVS